MSAPATGPAGNKPPKEKRPVRKRMSPGEIFSAWFNILFIVLSFSVLWPITLVYGFMLGLWASRHRLFPLKARVRRGHFWNALVIYLSTGLLIFGFLSAIIEAAGWRPAIGYAIFGIVGAGFAFSAVTVAIGRLHDRNMSGWWILLYYGVPATAIALCFALPLATTAGALSGDISNSLTGLTVLVMWPFILWAVFALGCRPGTVGPNRFGPEVPLSPKTRAPLRRPLANAAPSQTQGVSPQSAVPAPSAPVPPPPPPANPAPAAAIRTPATSPQALVMPMQALTAVVASSTAGAEPVPAFPVPADSRAGIRRLIADLISVKGRMDRRRYWICSAIQCVYALLAWLLIQVVTSDRNISQRAYWILVGAIAFLPAALSMVASGMKRLHDSNISGWWLPGFLIIFVVCGEAFFLIFDHQFVAMDGSFIFAIWVVATYQFGRLPGAVGPNRFGPDPYDQYAPTDG